MIYPVGAGLVFATMLTIEWGYGPFVANLVGSWRPSLLLDELESGSLRFWMELNRDSNRHYNSP